MARERKPMAELSRVLADVLKEAGLSHLPHEDKLRRNWETLLGRKAAHIASLESLRGWVLKVKVDNASWRHHMSFERESIKRRANEILGAELVREVVLV